MPTQKKYAELAEESVDNSSANAYDLSQTELMDILDPDLFFDLEGQRNHILHQAASVAKQMLQLWNDQLVTTYEDAYSKLQERRAAKGKTIPSLDTILSNLQRAPGERMELGAALVQEQCGSIWAVADLYADAEKVQEWKALILGMHDTHVAKSIAPFTLGQHPSVISADMDMIQQLFATTNAETRAIFVTLADAGMVGTLKEIKKLKKEIVRIHDKFDLINMQNDFPVLFLLAGIAIFEGVLVQLLYDYASGLTKSSFNINIYLVSVVAVIMFIVNCFLYGKSIDSDSPLSGIILFPKKHLLINKLQKLQKKKELIDIISELMSSLGQPTQSFEDLDSMRTEQLQELSVRLANIENLLNCTFEWGQKLDFATLDMLDNATIAELVTQINTVDEQAIKTRKEQLLAIAKQAQHDPALFAEFEKTLEDKLQRSKQLPLPMDILTLPDHHAPVETYKVIVAFDELVGTLTLDPAQLKQYQSLKDEVLAGERKDNSKNLKALQAYVKEISVPQENHPDMIPHRSETREQATEHLKSMGLGEDDISSLISILRVSAPDQDELMNRNTFVETPSHTVPLDLQELEKIIAVRKKQKVSLHKE